MAAPQIVLPGGLELNGKPVVDQDVEKSFKHRIVHTDRSRPTAAIRKIALKATNGRSMSQKAVDLMEDIMKHSCKEVMRAAASLCSGTSKTTVDHKIIKASFRLVFRCSGIQQKGHDAGIKAITRVNTAKASASHGTKNNYTKIAQIDLSIGRVETMLRSYMLKPCERLGYGSSVYAAGFIENFLGCVLHSADQLLSDQKKSVRIKTKEIANALHRDIELHGIIPEEIVVKFHGQSSGVKRARPASTKAEKKEAGKPSKKKSRKH